MKPILRHFQASEANYFIFGPRGTGKSTLLAHLYPDSLFINLLDPNTLRTYKASPNRFKELVLAHPESKTIVVDEIQHATEILSIVHDLIEQKQGWQFILTGSSSRKLKRTGVDLLGGRAHIRHLYPFMASELQNHFNLKKALEFGMLPLIIDSDTPKENLKAYIALYVREEVMMEGLVRKMDQFHQFLEAISFSQGSLLNYSNIASDCGISNKTVENYVNILEDLLIASKIPIFTKRAQRNLTKHPKFYYFDVGVFLSIRPRGPLDDLSAINGHSLETLVFQHLQAWLGYSDQEGRLFYWQTRTGLEVDFIIYGQCGFYAIEVKASQTIQPRDLKGLYAFEKDYPEADLIMLYAGNERRKINNVLCVPIEEFLLKLVPNQPLI